MDIAGIGENPATRSGPNSLIVCTCAAATSSAASSQVARTSPPLPRAALYRRGPLRVGDDVGPGQDRVAEARLGLPVHLEQHAAHVGVADPGGGVGVPGERRAARAAARLVLRPVRTDRRVVGLLRLPGDDAVLDVHLPRARAGAVHPVGGAHDLVVAPPVAVEGRRPTRPPIWCMVRRSAETSALVKNRRVPTSASLSRAVQALGLPVCGPLLRCSTVASLFRYAAVPAQARPHAGSDRVDRRPSRRCRGWLSAAGKTPSCSLRMCSRSRSSAVKQPVRPRRDPPGTPAAASSQHGFDRPVLGLQHGHVVGELARQRGNSPCSSTAVCGPSTGRSAGPARPSPAASSRRGRAARTCADERDHRVVFVGQLVDRRHVPDSRSTRTSGAALSACPRYRRTLGHGTDRRPHDAPHAARSAPALRRRRRPAAPGRGRRSRCCRRRHPSPAAGRSHPGRRRRRPHR